MKKIISILLGLIMFLTGCSQVLTGDEHTDNGVFSGMIQCEEYSIASEISGKLDNIYYDLGDMVEKNQIAAQLNKDLLYLERKSVLGQVEINNAKLDEALAGSRSQEIEQANYNISNIKSGINAQEEVIKILKKEFQDMTALKEAGGLPENELNKLRIEITNAEGKLNSLYEQLKSANSAKSLIYEGASNQSIDILKKTVNQAQTSVEIIDKKIDKCNIYSYFNGTVVSKNSEVGEIVPAGFPVLTIADIDNIYAYIFIPEKYLSNISLGKKVDIYSDIDENKISEGKISYISHKSEFTPRNVETKEEYSKTMFKVKVDIINNADFLRPGMMIDIKLW